MEPQECKQTHAHANRRATPSSAHTHTHTHTLAPSWEVISCSAGCTLLPRWPLGHPGFAHRVTALQLKEKNKGKRERSGGSQLPRDTAPPAASLGNWEEPRVRATVPATRLLLGCQRVPEHWPSGVLTWTSCPPRTLWASSAPCLRAAEEGEKATDTHLRPWVTLAQI